MPSFLIYLLLEYGGDMKLIRSIIAFLAVLSLCLPPLSSANLQKTYTVDDDIYRRVDVLCREAGVLGPSTFSPMSGRVLQIALERIDRDSLPADLQQEYDYLWNMIIDKEVTLDYGLFKADIKLGVNLQFNFADYSKFIFTNEDGYNLNHRNDVLFPYRYDDPSISIYPQLYYGDNVFLEGDFAVRNNPYRKYESSFGWLMTGTGGKFAFFAFGQNSGFASELPYKAGLSAGNDYISFVMGRYPHSIGNGITGNLVVGDNFTYQEVAALSLISNYFSYNISVTRFDQQLHADEVIYDAEGEPYVDPTGTKTVISRNEFQGPQQYRVVHRFDLNLFDRFRFAVNLGTIYNGNALDLRFFYPFVLQHNYYNYTNEIAKEYFDEANNIMGVEAEFIPVRGLSIGGQFVIDQSQVYFEDQTALPAAWGALANIKYSIHAFGGTFNTWFEGVYTNPYLYLNRKVDSDGDIDYNLDYIVGYAAQYLSDYGYSGYIYGPDLIVFSLGGEYVSSHSIWKAGLNLMYKVQGEKGLSHSYYDIRTTIIDMGNAVIEDDPDVFMNAKTPTGGWDKAEHLIKVALYGNYNFPEYNLELFAAAAFDSYINYNHVHGDFQFLPQVSIGVKWHGLNNAWFR